MGDNSRLEAMLILPGATGEIRVHAIRGLEEVSRAFRYEVDFSIDELDLDETRGALAQVHLVDALGTERFISGVVQAINVLAGSTERFRFRLVLVPRPYLLAYRHGFRIFQQMDVPEIVQKVFADAGIESKAFKWQLGGKYPKRSYCTQFDETEWNFVSRLLEEEGIYFTFEHSSDGHLMVFRDESSSAPAAQSELPFRYEHLLHGEAGRVWNVRLEARASVSKVVVNDYDLVKPSLNLQAQEEVADSAVLKREWYEYPGNYSAPSTGKRLARTRLEELRSERNQVCVLTNAI